MWICRVLDNGGTIWLKLVIVNILTYNKKVVRKVKNVSAYNPRSCFIVPDQSFGVFSRM